MPGVPIPAELAELEGEKRGTNNPTALFGRTDFILNQNNTLNLQYTYTRMRGENFDFDSPRQTTAESGNYTRIGSSNGLKGSLVTVFSPNIINEVKGQIATDNRLEEPNSNMPRINIAGFGDIGGNDGRPRQFDSTRFQLANNVSVTAGRHQLRFGFDSNINRVASERKRVFRADGILRIARWAEFRPPGLSNTLPDARDSFARRLATSDRTFSLRGTQQEYALFIQDRIRSQRLTVDAGFRWEAQINPQPDSEYPGIPEQVIDLERLAQFQPRLSMAFDITGDGRSVVRASAGIFTAHAGNLFQGYLPTMDLLHARSRSQSQAHAEIRRTRIVQAAGSAGRMRSLPSRTR